MNTAYPKEKELFRKLFHHKRIDQFEDRFKIIEGFLQMERHLTVLELHHHLVEKGISFPPEFVRQTLQMMCRFGFAQKRQFEDGQTRYELRHLGQHHDHMICTQCGKIIEFTNERLEQLQLEIAAGNGFHMIQHKMEIYGICSSCLANRAPLIPLDQAKPGEQILISDFVGGKLSQMRLMSMGIRLGDRVEVITGSHHGQVIIALGYNRLSIGPGLARKVLVRPA